MEGTGIYLKLVDLENYDVISARTKRGGGGRIILVARVTCGGNEKRREREREREREKSLCFRVSHSKWNEFSTSRNCAHMETRAISFLLIAVDVSLPLRCACFLSSFLPFLSLSLSLSLFSFLFFSFLSVNFAY